MKKSQAPKNNFRTWIEIDTKALRRNISAFRKLIGPKVKLMAVVKSNAYGHGLLEYAHASKTKKTCSWAGRGRVILFWGRNLCGKANDPGREESDSPCHNNCKGFKGKVQKTSSVAENPNRNLEGYQGGNKVPNKSSRPPYPFCCVALPVIASIESLYRSTAHFLAPVLFLSLFAVVLKRP